MKDQLLGLISGIEITGIIQTDVLRILSVNGLDEVAEHLNSWSTYLMAMPRSCIQEQ